MNHFVHIKISGTETQCQKVMSTIEKNSSIKNIEPTSSSQRGQTKLASTITVEQGPLKQVTTSEEPDDESMQGSDSSVEYSQSAQHSIIDDVQNHVTIDSGSDSSQDHSDANEPEDEQTKENDSSPVRPKENFNGSFCI